MRDPLDNLLTLAVQAKEFGPAVYDELLAWKGALLDRQRATRAAAENPEIGPILEELRQTASRLATLSFASPSPQQAPIARPAALVQAATPRKPLVDVDHEEEIDVVDAIDPNLFPIFEEEAAELMPSLGSALRAWAAHPQQREPRV